VDEAIVETDTFREIDSSIKEEIEGYETPIRKYINMFDEEKDMMYLDATSNEEDIDDKTLISVDTILFAGNKMISSGLIQALIKKLLSSEHITPRDLQHLLKSIQKLYYDEGFLMVDIHLNATTSNNNSFVITIDEHRLTKDPHVLIYKKKDDVSWLNNFLSHKEGEPLNFKKLEREIKILNELPGYQATAKIRPRSLNTEQVNVYLNKTDKINGKVSYDNFGARAIGTERIRTKLTINQPLNFGDQLILSAVNSTNELFNLYNMNYSFPLNTNGLRAFAQYSTAHYRLGSYLDASPASHGDLDYYSVGLEYPLYLKQNFDLRLGASNNKYDFKSFRNNLNVSNKSRVSNTFYLKGKFNDYFNGLNFFNLSAHDGRTIIDNLAEKNLDQSSSGEDTLGDYQKVYFNFYRSQSILNDLKLDLNYVFQTASRNIDSSERLRVGGPYAVRAYATGEGLGTMGYMINADLKYYFQKQNKLITTGSIFYDLSNIKKYKDHYSGLTNNDLIYRGWGLAIYHRYDNFVVKGTWSKRIGDNPDPLSNGKDYDYTKKMDRFWLMGEYYF
jgi:hemolysin activation/secretion protein